MTGTELTTRQGTRVSYGTVCFTSEVLANLAGLAAADVPGVAGMSGRLADGVTEFLGRKNLSRGIAIEIGERDDIAVGADIIVEYGKRIHQVAREVQEKIRQSIESMTGLKVSRVNVRVQALKMA